MSKSGLFGCLTSVAWISPAIGLTVKSCNPLAPVSNRTVISCLLGDIRAVETVVKIGLD